MSRTAFLKLHAGKTPKQIFAEQTAGIDARAFCGIVDASELPGAYKNAAMVRRQIAEFGLAEVRDTIEPYGSIMAGDWQRDAPWRKKAGRRREARRRFRARFRQRMTMACFRRPTPRRRAPRGWRCAAGNSRGWRAARRRRPSRGAGAPASGPPP